MANKRRKKGVGWCNCIEINRMHEGKEPTLKINGRWVNFEGAGKGYTDFGRQYFPVETIRGTDCKWCGHYAPSVKPKPRKPRKREQARPEVA